MSRTDINILPTYHYGLCHHRVWVTNLDGVGVNGWYSVTDEYPKDRLSSAFAETRSGVTSPGFWNPKRVTALPFNAFSFEKKERWESYGETKYYSLPFPDSKRQYLWDVGASSGNAPSYASIFDYPASVLSASEISSLDSQARNRLISKVKDEKINLAQFYAERIQAVEMFTETIVKLTGSIRDLRKGDILGAAAKLGYDITSPRKRARLRQRVAKSRGRSKVRSLSNDWLALQFGWLPLLSDVEGAAQAIAKSLNDIHYGRATQTLIRKTDRVEQIVRPSYNKYGGFTNVTSKVTETYVIKYEVRFHTTNAVLQSFAGLGLTNPLDLAWELLPFSFVVDWFFPIGKFLENLDAFVGLAFDDGLKTVFIHQKRTGEGLQQGWDENRRNFHESTFGTSHFSWTKHVRTKLTSFPEVPYPELRNPFSPTHIADALSLLVQHFK